MLARSLCISSASCYLVVLVKNFRRLNVDGFLLIYKSYIKPLLEYYCASMVTISSEGDTVPGKRPKSSNQASPITILPYEERLNRLGITSCIRLYQRRIRGDLVETYKILTGKVNVGIGNFLSLHTGSYNARGHSLKLSVQRRSTQSTRAFSASVSSTFGTVCHKTSSTLQQCQHAQEKTGQVLYRMDMSVKG